MLNDLALVIWGGDTFTVPVPSFLQGAIVEFGVFYPKFRLFVLLVGVLVFVGLWLLLNRTRLGALIRAGVDDAEMVEASGINIRRVFLLTFMLGSALSGLGGLLGGAFLTLYPSADSEILVFSLAVVIIGGRGSLEGAAIGSLFIGLFNTFGQVWFPELAYFVIFGPMPHRGVLGEPNHASARRLGLEAGLQEDRDRQPGLHLRARAVRRPVPGLLGERRQGHPAAVAPAQY